jgi:phage regulator Rha-like protein
MTAAKPTQSELLQGGLVDITAHHKSVETNSLKIAQNLEVQHSDVTRIIKRLIANEAISQRTVSVSDYLSDRGKLYNFYHLREVEALQVIMSLTGAKAEKLHKEIAQAFVSVKKENAEWRAQALITTSTTKQANDQVYWLRSELAEIIPTSKRCTMIYVHIQGAINKAVTGKANTKRDTMTACQLQRVGKLEQQVYAHIEQLKREGLPALHIRDEVLAGLKAA